MFGTFLCNSLSERRRNYVSGKTRSVWDYLDHHHVKFRNFLYENRLSKQMVDPLWPRSEVRDLLLWKDVYVVSELKVGPSLNSQAASASSTTNNTASSSGMNSRCEDLSSVDQVDSGANSSKEDDDNRRENEENENSCDEQKFAASEEESNHDDGGEGGQEHSESNQDTITANTKKCDTKQQGSILPGTMAQYRLGHAKGIESSTDTLVAEQDDRNGSSDSTTMRNTTFNQQVTKLEGPTTTTNANNITKEEGIIRKSCFENGGNSSNSHLLLSTKCRVLTEQHPHHINNDIKNVSNGVSKKQFSDMENNGCPPQCLMGCDLSQYFKEPIDTDGLTAHHNEVQERLMRIFATHQAEVQALRRDLQCTKLALLKQKSISNHGTSLKSDSELLLVDIDSAARACVAMTVGNNGVNCSGSSSTGACSDASSTWEMPDEKEANPTLWVPDHAVAACMK